jgi:hypothetical protein
MRSNASLNWHRDMSGTNGSTLQGARMMALLHYLLSQMGKAT